MLPPRGHSLNTAKLVRIYVKLIKRVSKDIYDITTDFNFI